MNEILSVKGLTKTYRLGKKNVAGLRSIDLSIPTGETFGIVGESGCGKSTLGRLALRLEDLSSGEIYFQNQPIHELSSKQMLPLRRRMQMIFQDSYASLNPRMCIADIVSEGLLIHERMDRATCRARAADMLAQVGLPAAALDRYPHEFSGGQRQRINIARALILQPEFVVCDEPLSALDASIQAQVMELLISLKKHRQLTYLFISHDLRAIKAIADTVAVMYLGQIVEQAPAHRLFAAPKHPYTQALFAAVPSRTLRKNRAYAAVSIKGELPSALSIPAGCPFHTRCPKATTACQQLTPTLREIAPHHLAACHLLTKS